MQTKLVQVQGHQLDTLPNIILYKEWGQYVEYKVGLRSVHNELRVQSIPYATLVNQLKYQSDQVFERKFLVYNL